jgi:hypothetical protein
MNPDPIRCWVVLIGADRVVHQVQQDDADESDKCNSLNSMLVSIPNDGNTIAAAVEADQPDQLHIWSTSMLKAWNSREL